MACACGKKNNAPETFVVTLPGGEQKSYSTEVEAAAAARRSGGSYRKAA
jgi:hypothetical protein